MSPVAFLRKALNYAWYAMKPIWKSPSHVRISQTCPSPPGNVVLADCKDLVHLPRISGHSSFPNPCGVQLQRSVKHPSRRACAAEAVCADP